MQNRTVKASAEDLLQEIGRQHVENKALNLRITQLEAANAELSQELSKLRQPPAADPSAEK
jgi:hypothetical protein